MNSKTIILSSTGLKNIVRENNVFTFSFGERKISMNIIFAEFISPIVSHLHHSDPTINQLHYDIPQNTKTPLFDEIFTDEVITKLKLISSGTTTDLSESEGHKMRLASILLGNDELFSKLDELYPVDDSADETVKRLEELEVIEIMKNNPSENSLDAVSTISSIARNFYRIDKSKVKTISKSLFHSIIVNDHLKIESEDWLFDAITEYFDSEEQENGYETDFSDITSFLEEVKMRNLSEEKFKELLLRVKAGEMTECLWRNIRDRIISEEGEGSDEEELRKRYTKETTKPSTVHSRVFSFDGQESNRLNGIISFLTKEAGGNVHEKGVVSVTASSEFDGSRCAKNVVDFDNIETRLFTNNLQNSWLMYDFKDRKVRPTHYSIRSIPFGPVACHPMHWVIEASNSGTDEDWTVIDTRSGVTSLKAKSVVCTFNIKQQGKESKFYRFLRLRQTGTNAYDQHNLCFSSLEYFGSVI